MVTQAVRQRGGGDPAFPQDQAGGSMAMEDALKMLHDGVVFGRSPRIANYSGRERPIVVPAAAILPFLNPFAADALTGEMFHRTLDSFAVGFAHIHQHTVHVEHQEVHHISSRAARKRRACSRVPTVTLTHPAIS